MEIAKGERASILQRLSAAGGTSIKGLLEDVEREKTHMPNHCASGPEGAQTIAQINELSLQNRDELREMKVLMTKRQEVRHSQ